MLPGRPPGASRPPSSRESAVAGQLFIAVAFDSRGEVCFIDLYSPYNYGTRLCNLLTVLKFVTIFDWHFITPSTALAIGDERGGTAVFSSSKCDHITPLLRQLHWMKVPRRIDFKLQSRSGLQMSSYPVTVIFR